MTPRLVWREIDQIAATYCGLLQLIDREIPVTKISFVFLHFRDQRKKLFFVWCFVDGALWLQYSGLLAPRLSLYNVCFHLTRSVFVVWMCSLQLFCSPCACYEGLQGFGRPGQESNSRTNSTKADALTTWPRAGLFSKRIARTHYPLTEIIRPSYPHLD